MVPHSCQPRRPVPGQGGGQRGPGWWRRRGRAGALAAGALAAVLLGAGCLEEPAPSPSPWGRPLVTGAFVHKPYLEGRCDVCHDRQADMHASASPDLCLSCHRDLTNRFAFTHGAVIAGACLRCHSPHESQFPALLLAADQSLCTQCHSRGDLSLRATAHRNSRRSCLECHVGHGGATHAMLRPEASVPGGPPEAAAGTTEHVVRSR